VDEPLDGRRHPLGHPRDEIERAHDELLVDVVAAARRLGLQRRLHQAHAPHEDRLRKLLEADAQRLRDTDEEGGA